MLGFLKHQIHLNHFKSRRKLMKKYLSISLALALLIVFAGFSLARADVAKGEKDFYEGIKKEIPADKIKNVKDLYKVWQDVQTGKSKAILIDVRTQPEFETGHIEGTNLVTLTHVYTMPRHFKDENAEYWIWCRTANRAVYFAWLMQKYGYKNVNCVIGGVVDWMKEGYPLVNRFMGRFKVEEYGHPFKEKGPVQYREFVDYK
jgi:rhodanese-related sulfurtransferase